VATIIAAADVRPYLATAEPSCMMKNNVIYFP
jgi:hypothetical protein